MDRGVGGGVLLLVWRIEAAGVEDSWRIVAGGLSGTRGEGRNC